MGSASPAPTGPRPVPAPEASGHDEQLHNHISLVTGSLSFLSSLSNQTRDTKLEFFGEDIHCILELVHQEAHRAQGRSLDLLDERR